MVCRACLHWPSDSAPASRLDASHQVRVPELTVTDVRTITRTWWAACMRHLARYFAFTLLQHGQAA